MSRPLKRAIAMMSLLVAGLAPRALGAAPAEPGWLAYGDLRGHLEPCGCDPATDLGGIKRLGVVVERERAAHPEAILLSLGNNVPEAGAAPLKTPYLAATDARLKPLAALLNVLEIQRQAELLTLGAPGGKALPAYVLSNLRQNSPLRRISQTRRGDGRVAVLGYAFAPSVAADVEALSPALLTAWRTELAAVPPATARVLLFAGSDAELGRIVDAKVFDVIISSSTAPFGTEPDDGERRDESRLWRHRAPDVAMVPLGGQGLLRGGPLRFDAARPISEILKQPAPAAAAPGLFDRPATLVTWLDPAAAPGDGPLQDLYGQYQEAARQAFAGAGAARLKDLKNSPYAGAQACAACHPAASRIYAGMQHARAMQTLINKGKQEDGECVACHSVGARAKGGFVSLAASPQLANVQCENCHGPRLAHTKDPMGTPKPAQPAREVCTTCHNPQHSPRFDFSTYWPRIAHANGP